MSEKNKQKNKSEEQQSIQADTKKPERKKKTKKEPVARGSEKSIEKDAGKLVENVFGDEEIWQELEAQEEAPIADLHSFRKISQEDWQEESENSIKEEFENKEEFNSLEVGRPLIEKSQNFFKKEDEINESEKNKELIKLAPLIKEVKKNREELAKKEIEYNRYKFLTGNIGNLFKKEEKSQIKSEYENAKCFYQEAKEKLAGEYEKAVIGSVDTKKTKGNLEEGKEALHISQRAEKLIFGAGFLSKEMERLEKAKAENLPEKDKKRYKEITKKIYKSYSNLPRPARWAVSASLGAGVAFGVGVIGASALAGYGAYRFNRLAFASLSGAGTEKLAGLMEKFWLDKKGGSTKEERQEKVKSDFRKKAEETEDFYQISGLTQKMQNERDIQLAKLAKSQKHWRVGKWMAVAAVGGSVSFLAGGGFTSDTAKDDYNLGDLDDKTVKKEVDKLAKKIVEQDAVEQKVDELAEEIKESHKVNETAFIEKAKSGDSVWKMAERQLQDHYGEEFENLEEGQKTYIIDSIKDKIAQNPEQFGLKDIDKLQKDQEVNFQEIISDEQKMNEVFNQAENLNKDAIGNIENNNQILEDWVKDHPEEQLTSEKANEILYNEKTKGLEITDSTTGNVKETSVSLEAEELSPDLQNIIEKYNLKNVSKEQIESALNIIEKTGLSGTTKEGLEEMYFNNLNRLSVDEVDSMFSDFFGSELYDNKMKNFFGNARNITRYDSGLIHILFDPNKYFNNNHLNIWITPDGKIEAAIPYDPTFHFEEDLNSQSLEKLKEKINKNIELRTVDSSPSVSNH